MLNKQSGATLGIVLVFLLILTVLAVTSMSGSIIQQKSSTNMYLESESFHVADSAISALVNADRLNERALYGTEFTDDIANVDPVTGEIDPIIPYFCIGESGKVTKQDTKDACVGTNFDGIGGLSAVAKIEYLGCKTCPGNEFGGLIGCNAWKITGFSDVASSSQSEVNNWVVKTAGCSSGTGTSGTQPILGGS